MTLKSANHIAIKELSNAEEMYGAYPLVAQMYNKMDFTTYKKNIDEMMLMNGYKMLAAFDGEKMVGVCGYWLLLMLYCGRYIQISNLVVDKNSRSFGVGKKILDHFETMARKLKCDKVVLDSYTENKKSHSLYYRENFYIRGFHFMKDIG